MGVERSSAQDTVHRGPSYSLFYARSVLLGHVQLWQVLHVVKTEHAVSAVLLGLSTQSLSMGR